MIEEVARIEFVGGGPLDSHSWVVFTEGGSEFIHADDGSAISHADAVSVDCYDLERSKRWPSVSVQQAPRGRADTSIEYAEAEMTDTSTLALLIGAAGGAVGTVGNWIAPAAQDFFWQVLAPVRAEAATTSIDFIASRRAKRLELLALGAAQQVRDGGREIASVPERTLVPLREGSTGR